MKKSLLFISTLFAAGTLVANATTTITATTYLAFDGTSGGADLTNSGTNSSLTVTGSGGYLNYYTVDGGAIGVRAYHNNSNYLTLTNTGISWTSNWTIAFSFNYSDVIKGGTTDTKISFDDWANLLGIANTDNSTYVEIQTKGSADAGVAIYGDGTNITTTAGTNVSVSGYSKLVLTYSYDSTTGGALTLYNDGTAVATGTITAANAKATSIDKILLGTGISNHDKHEGLYDEFAIYDAALTAKQVSTYLSDGTKASPLTIIIPEPSMFGLLAGTLALGLAGTRRRRRAK